MKIKNPLRWCNRSVALSSFAVLLWVPNLRAEVTIESLGVGADSLIGGDLVDPEDDGEDVMEAGENPADYNWNVVSFFSSHEPEFEGAESAFNVFDNKLGGGVDKWCCDDPVFDEDPEFAAPVWVGFQLAAPTQLGSFTVSSANDTPDRDPTIWEIQGSNDGENWSTIYHRGEDEEVPWTSRLEVIKFTLDLPSEPFTYFRYIAFETPGSLHQIGELEFFAYESTHKEGLVGYWTFDATLEDSSPAPFNTSHGALEGGDDDEPTYETGKFGTGIKLDGIGEFVRVNPEDEPYFDGVNEDLETIGFTLSTWFRVDGFDKSWQCLAGKGEGNNWRLARNGANSGISGVGGSPDTPLGPTNVNDGELHLVVLRSVPEEGVQLFVDGELEGESAAPTLDDGDLDMLIGENPGALGRTWNGLIDDMAFWERPLTDEEIAKIWNNGAGSSVGELLGRFLPDADQDGIPDFYEEKFDFLDPNNAADAAEDQDGDTLSNLAEYNGGTAPDKKDTDSDGLDDNVETNTGVYVDVTNTGTSPTKADSDKDGLLDGVETKTGNFVSATDTGTDPFNADSDGDGRKDGREVENGTNPLDAGDPPPPDPTAIVSGYWPLDADLEDASGNGGDGTLMGGDDDIPDFVEGKLGTALSLDGIGEYVEINPDLEDLYSGYDVDGGEPNPDGFAVSVWFKVGVWDKDWQCLVAKGEGNNWRVHRRGAEGVITGNGGNGDVPNNGLVQPEDDDWHFLVLSSNPTDDLAQLWVDGQLEGENTGLVLTDNAMPMMIGENPDARNRTWNGLVDDVAFFNRSLTEEEVMMLWNDGEGASVGEVFLGAAPSLGFQITNVERLPAVDGAAQLKVTWNSAGGATYAVDSSPTIPEETDAWEEVADGVESGGDETSYTISFLAEEPQLYIRVRKE
ncbi:MAG: LamG-like jellyroll fold domain-containing protein [Verrucomicrobiales bacterium]